MRRIILLSLAIIVLVLTAGGTAAAQPAEAAKADQPGKPAGAGDAAKAGEDGEPSAEDDDDDDDDDGAATDRPAGDTGRSGDDDDDDDDDDLLGDLDELVLKFGGAVQSDIRFRVEEKSVGSTDYDRMTLPVGVDRNENILKLKLNATYGNVTAVADVDLVLYGFSQDIDGLGALSRYEAVDPFRIEAHSLYVSIKDLFLDGLDLRVGQQQVLWGVGDQFNPTNNLNADDVEDVLLFGSQQGNMMVKLDYWISSDWSLSGVLVPVFRPALVPRSAALGLSKLDRLPMVDEFLRHRIHAEQAAAAGSLIQHQTIVASATPVVPELTPENMQLAFRIGGTVLDQDVALSYYYGRTDFPVPFANHTRHRCLSWNDESETQCRTGLLETDVSLHYPRMHVYGLNMAGEIGWKKKDSSFAGPGYRLELALVVPERATMRITQDALPLLLQPQAAGEYDYNGRAEPGIGPEPTVIEDTPFAKWVLGLDYTFHKNVYANVQWVHGMPDEYGAGDFITEGYAVRSGGVLEDSDATICALQQDGTECAVEVLRPRIADYLVIGLDVRWLNQKLLTRLFTIFDLNGVWESRPDPDNPGERLLEHHGMFSDLGFSAIIYPEINYSFGNGLDLGAGALLQIGKDHSKFGDPAAGGSLVWARTRFQF